MSSEAALRSHHTALRTRYMLLLGAARQYRAAEKRFNSVIENMDGKSLALERAKRDLLEAREVFDQIIAPVDGGEE